jgi:hypothetical protein
LFPYTIAPDKNLLNSDLDSVPSPLSYPANVTVTEDPLEQVPLVTIPVRKRNERQRKRRSKVKKRGKSRKNKKNKRVEKEGEKQTKVKVTMGDNCRLHVDLDNRKESKPEASLLEENLGGGKEW